MKPRPEFVLCQADPFAMACAQRSSESVRQEERFRKAALAMGARIGSLLTKHHDYAVKHGIDRQSRGFGYAWAKVRQDLTKATRAKLVSNVRKALQSFRSTLSKFPRFSEAQRKTIDSVLEACFSQPPILDVNSIATRNAVVARKVRPAMTLPDQQGRVTDALVETLGDCQLRLSGMEWQECAEGTPECFSTLFHEFGHALNSCAFVEAAYYAEQEQKDLGAAPPEHIEETLKRLQGKIKPLQADEARTLLVSQLGDTARQARELGRLFKEASSCLSATSSPKRGVRNTCEAQAELPAEEKEYCGYDAARGFPSQWDEAEADAWSAVAFSDWLQQSYPSDVEKRRQAARQALEAWCVEGVEAATPLSPEEREERTQAMLKKELASFGVDPDDSALAAVLRSAHGLGKTPLPCEMTPMSREEKPWGDEHQEWSHRVNRNYYLNAELRTALGCARPERSCALFRR